MVNGPEQAAPTPAHRPRDTTPAELGFIPASPVAWLSPVQLAGTGLRVALSSIQGGYLDKRELQASFPDEVHREIGPDGDCWIDFVADLGDGFDATYSIAYLLAQPQLTVGEHVLPRGRALILGGDEVYPTPNAERYENRMVGPYHAALPAVAPGEDHPNMYALPGNHDWYDGLTAFLRLFTGTRRTGIGGWRLPQHRSYFAVELPGDWWLLAVDDQDSTYIDDPQLAYFSRVAANFGPQTKVIVASASPTWVQGDDVPGVYASLDYLVRSVVAPTEAQVRVMLSGDWHHYARYGNDERELITCGGGGAYLFPTHQLPETIEVPPADLPSPTPRETFSLRSRFPGKRLSQAYAASIFARLPKDNPSFIAMVGTLHTAILLAASGVIKSDFGSPLQKFALVPLVFLMSLVMAGTYAFAHLSDSVLGGLRRRVLGVLHGIAHLGLAALGTWAWWVLPLHAWPWPWSLIAEIGIYGVLSGLAATELVAVYLLIAARFNVNLNELFSAQGIVDSKSFLRLHVAADGTLTIYPIGVRKVSRSWRVTPEGQPHESWLAPQDKLHARLIESPIVLKP
ncbi:metallophosphoesterase [Actinoplanes awajinensis]|uniref:Metallophosphoesterase n=1 Tax=Actinoplanes awajinensis subsp. mycoplanecinus TaxID=135947 RepID=A0A101J915_9ACTN|nr:metallophosphoesterase [Actinoplanes awajinensis]KUL22371.1 metallophosphoesterase [Actinoplanes awajinensis subsp. mycoplanecinus]